MHEIWLGFKADVQVDNSLLKKIQAFHDVFRKEEGVCIKTAFPEERDQDN